MDRRRLGQIGAADHVRDALRGIVHHHRQMVGRTLPGPLHHHIAHRVDQGMFTLDEATSGRADTPGAPAAPRSLDDARDRLRANNTNFKRNATAPAAFAPGDSLTTTPFPIAGHSRLPAYARGKTGTIHTLRGAYPDPTEGAKGNDVPTHLYTVEFASTELWGPDQNPSDTVLVDVFEGDLVSA